MRHYEIVFLVHPDQSEQVPAMIQRYISLIQGGSGRVHRLENLGRMAPAYPVNKLFKVHYVLLNIECDQKTIKELTENFRFNDAILRHLIMGQARAITEPSLLLKEKEISEARGEATSVATSHSILTKHSDKSTHVPAAA